MRFDTQIASYIWLRMDNGNELKKETAVITELRTQKSESKLNVLYVKLGFHTSYEIWMKVKRIVSVSNM